MFFPSNKGIFPGVSEKVVGDFVPKTPSFHKILLNMNREDSTPGESITEKRCVVFNPDLRQGGH